MSQDGADPTNEDGYGATAPIPASSPEDTAKHGIALPAVGADPGAMPGPATMPGAATMPGTTGGSQEVTPYGAGYPGPVPEHVPGAAVDPRRPGRRRVRVPGWPTLRTAFHGPDAGLRCSSGRRAAGAAATGAVLGSGTPGVGGPGRVPLDRAPGSPRPPGRDGPARGRPDGSDRRPRAIVTTFGTPSLPPCSLSSCWPQAWVSATPTWQPTSSTTANPAASGNSGNSGSSGNSGVSPFGSGNSGSSGSGSSGSGSSGSGATGAGGPSDVSSIANGVNPGLVDINTTLSYQGAQAAGTGMVLTSSGEVLTNNHVINGATSITATDVGNGKTYTASVVGYDRSQDVAVIQLHNASGLQTVTLGNSSNASAGRRSWPSAMPAAPVGPRARPAERSLR